MNDELTWEMLDELKRYLDKDCVELRLYHDRETYQDWTHELETIIAGARKGLEMERVMREQSQQHVSEDSIMRDAEHRAGICGDDTDDRPNDSLKEQIQRRLDDKDDCENVNILFRKALAGIEKLEEEIANLRQTNKQVRDVSSGYWKQFQEAQAEIAKKADLIERQSVRIRSLKGAPVSSQPNSDDFTKALEEYVRAAVMFYRPNDSLKERLREPGGKFASLCHEALDHIEQLEKKNAILEADKEQICLWYQTSLDHIAKLQEKMRGTEK